MSGTVNEPAKAADLFIAEMTALGCRFEISGPENALRWHYEAGPGLRDKARAFMVTFERPAFGFDLAMITAIRRREAALLSAEQSGGRT